VQAAGLPSGLPQLAVMVQRSALQSAELWAQWGVLLQRHHRPLITVTTVTGITATTATDNTRVTTGDDIIAPTADKPWRAQRRPPNKCALGMLGRGCHSLQAAFSVIARINAS